MVVAAEQSNSGAVLVRPLGAFERMLHRYMEFHPMHFVVAAEFDTVLTENQVSSALAAVQARHPLLSVQVEDHPATRLGYYRSPDVPAIELTVFQNHDARSWQSMAARELARRFGIATGPLMRAVLITDTSSSTILLTLEHTAGDGISATILLDDLVAALNGRQLVGRSVPDSQEELIASSLPPVEELELEQVDADPRQSAPLAFRPFDGVPPKIDSIAFDAELTTALVARCRAERTTVHGAIVAAASRVRSSHCGEEFVRAATLINIRHLIGGEGDCADYFQGTLTGLAPLDGEGFWDQARSVQGKVALARSAAGAVATSTAVQQFIPFDVDAATAEHAPPRGELVISNLGKLAMDSSGPIRPSAVWGPLLLVHSEGETVIGIVTFEGRLRMVTCGYRPDDHFLADLRQVLSDACG